jgi:hypothetical protein
MKRLILAALLFPIAAQAYVPPTPFLLKGMAQKHSGLKGLRIKSLVTAYDGDKPTTYRFREVLHFNPGSGVVRSAAYDESGAQKLYVTERRGAESTVADAILFWASVPAITGLLKERGLPVHAEEETFELEPLTMARMGTLIAWVIGGGPKSGTPQLWLEKDTFLPLKWVEGKTELVFEGQRFYHEYPYPRSIHLNAKGAQLRAEVQEVALVLDTAEFRAPVTTPGFTDASMSGSVRDAIQAFYEWVR